MADDGDQSSRSSEERNKRNSSSALSTDLDSLQPKLISTTTPNISEDNLKHNGDQQQISPSNKSFNDLVFAYPQDHRPTQLKLGHKDKSAPVLDWTNFEIGNHWREQNNNTPQSQRLSVSRILKTTSKIARRPNCSFKSKSTVPVTLKDLHSDIHTSQKLCFHCHATDHRFNECPKQLSFGGMPKNSDTGSAKREVKIHSQLFYQEKTNRYAIVNYRQQQGWPNSLFYKSPDANQCSNVDMIILDEGYGSQEGKNHLET